MTSVRHRTTVVFEGLDIDDFFDAFMSNSISQGKIWGIPWQRSTPILYYNKDLFRAAGLEEPGSQIGQLALTASSSRSRTARRAGTRPARRPATAATATTAASWA